MQGLSTCRTRRKEPAPDSRTSRALPPERINISNEHPRHSISGPTGPTEFLIDPWDIGLLPLYATL